MDEPIVVSNPNDSKAGEELVYTDIRQLLEQARHKTAQAVNNIIVETYWKIGKRISEEVGERAEYGKHLLDYLSMRLTTEFGKGFTERNLRQMRQFYQTFPIRHTLRTELSWSHYRRIMRVGSEEARTWYANAAAEGHWSERELKRQIDSHQYDRLLHSQKATDIEQADHTGKPEANAMDNVFKDPYVLEFLDIDSEGLLEADLEQALIDSLQAFLLELGNGFSFVGRQKRLSDGADDYYIDLVFYNYLLNCFVLIDLKTGKLTPQDVGQMDFYRRLYDDLYRPDGANPTVGLILCAEHSETVARYSALADGNPLLAAEYLTRLPTEEDLISVIERNKREFERRSLPQAADC